jgi:hypothetical protein
MIQREEQLATKISNLLNEYTKGSLIGSDYSTHIKPRFELIRDLFYRSDQAEWKLMKCYFFILEKNIEPDHFILFLEELFNERFPNNYFRNGRKSAMDFIITLKNSPKFKRKIYNRPKIKHLELEEYIELLIDLRCFKEKYVKGISHNKWIELISQTFDIEKTPSTFRKDYYEYGSK